ncbi:unnamed protein product [Tilletia controversa]|nr:unnamed protein product [Tilletia controversa]CAD6922681.1 unnamed protein product [Tilletia controversa]
MRMDLKTEVPFQVRFIVPVHEPRWRDFQGVTVGHFISARGRLSSLTDGTNATLHVDLEQLTNAPIAQVESSGSSGQSGHQMLSIVSTSAWDAPPTISRPSTSAATSPGPSCAESATLVTIGEAATSGAGTTSTSTASSTGNRISGLLTPSPTPTSRTATTLASGSSLSSSPLYRNSPYAMGGGTTSSAARKKQLLQHAEQQRSGIRQSRGSASWL